MFGKLYYLRAWNERYTLLGDDPIRHEVSRDMLHRGVCDAIRYRFTDWIMAKLSYEYATRSPRPDEIFGNVYGVQRPGRSFGCKIIGEI